jgi:hypothetical protein
MAVDPSIQDSDKNRWLYMWVAVFFPVVALTGFARTYYLKGLFGTPLLTDLLLHLYGFVMTACVVLFVAQVPLVAAHRTKQHQPLGVFGAM